MASSSISEECELQRCVQWIDENHFKKVALQFPDDLLHLSDVIALELQKRTTAVEISILADTSYGSCCVDEIAAEHVAANAIIHFGPACLTPCSRLPVLYIFEKWSVDSKLVAKEFLNLIIDKSVNCVLMFDVIYSHASSVIYDDLIENFPNLILCELQIPGLNSGINVPRDSNVYINNGRLMKLREGLNINDYAIFYVGHEGQTLSNLMLTMNKCQFYSFDPVTEVARKENANINKTLQKRYYAVEKARNAQIVGILVGTLGVSKYLQIIERLKEVARHAGKKAYTLVVGRLNPSKLANFPEIDIFVLTACPENSMLDYKDYYRPIITPFEFELACVEDRQWTGDYITDFQQLVPGAPYYTPLYDVSPDNVRTSVSLITGQMNILSQKSQMFDLPSAAVQPRESLSVAEIHNNAGGEYLIHRSWKGLESSSGKTPAALIMQGKHGTASSYENETKLMDN